MAIRRSPAVPVNSAGLQRAGKLKRNNSYLRNSVETMAKIIAEIMRISKPAMQVWHRYKLENVSLRRTTKMQACFFCRSALEVPSFYLATAAATFWPCMELHGIEGGCLAHHLISCKTKAAKGSLEAVARHGTPRIALAVYGRLLKLGGFPGPLVTLVKRWRGWVVSCEPPSFMRQRESRHDWKQRLGHVAPSAESNENLCAK